MSSRRLASALLLSLGVLTFAACSHGGGTAAAAPAKATASVVATVADTDGRFLAGVTIRVQTTGAVAQSDANGRATIAVPVGGEQVLRLHKDGFAERSDVLDLPAGTTASSFTAVLIARAAPVAIASVQTGGTFTGRDGASVTLPANALVDAQGHATSGAAEVAITPLDVRTDLRAFPGLFEGIPEGAPRTPIVTWGTTEFAFSQNAAALQLAANVVASIVLPIYVPTNQGGSAIAAGQVLPLWSFDESTGIWRQEGSGTVVAAAASPTGFALAANVAHFSWWNVDQARALGGGNEPFHAHVVCRLAAEGGQPVRDLPPGVAATVRITVGDTSSPAAVAVSTVTSAGADELIPAEVPVLLEANASFGTAEGAFVVAHGTLAQTLPTAGAGIVEILMQSVEVPAPRIVAPFDGAATNSSSPLYVEITLDGAQPDSVELAADGVVLATFPPQFFYRFFWDTSTAFEGTHTLVATAFVDGASRPSASRQVIVDRTPPHVLQITPVPGTEISGRPDLDVQFDEAVTPFPFRLQDAVVLSRANGSVVQPLANTSQLGDGGATLHVVPAAPLTFGTIGLSWGALRDAAGNAVTTVAATWPFDRTPALPSLTHVANGSPLAIAVSSTGVPFVVHVPANDELAVSRYDDASGTWIQLPGPINTGTITNGQVPSLAIDAQGSPILCYAETVAGTRRYVVARFDGTWQTMGTPLAALAGEGESDLAIDSLGRPVIAIARNFLVDVRRFDPVAHDFVSLGAPFFGFAQLVSPVDIGLKPDGNPVVAWNEGVFGSNAIRLQAREFDGTTWQPLGSVIDSVPDATQQLDAPSLVVDGTAFYVASNKRNNGDHLTVRRWNGSAWVDTGFVGSPAPASNFNKPGLAIRNGQPVLAYSSSNNVFVSAFDGTSWATGFDATGQTTNGSPSPRIALGGGRVFLAHMGCCSSLGHVVEILFP